MIYDLTKQADIDSLKDKLLYHKSEGHRVEVKKYSPPRSYRQNRYLHLIISYFALEYGDFPDYVKQDVFKKTVNPDLFITEYVNSRTGEVRDRIKSTTELTQKEMSIAIDRFIVFAQTHMGITLPDAEDWKRVSALEEYLKNNS